MSHNLESHSKLCQSCHCGTIRLQILISHGSQSHFVLCFLVFLFLFDNLELCCVLDGSATRVMRAEVSDVPV